MKNTGMLLPTRSQTPSGGIELHGKSAHVARRVGRAARARHRREAHEHRRLDGRILQRRRHGEMGVALIDLEEAVSGSAAGMDNPLGNALVVEVRDLLTHQDVFEQRRPPHMGLQRILVVADGHALVGRQFLAGGLRVGT